MIIITVTSLSSSMFFVNGLPPRRLKSAPPPPFSSPSHTHRLLVRIPGIAFATPVKIWGYSPFPPRFAAFEQTLSVPTVVEVKNPVQGNRHSTNHEEWAQTMRTLLLKAAKLAH